MTATRGELPEQMTSKIEHADNGCWNWTGAKTLSGYGSMSRNGTTALAHRVAYEVVKGEIDEGLQVDHLCRNVACVNPEHLEAVTGIENMRRRYAAQTHCKRGHEFTPENTRIYRRATGEHRECKTCRAMHNAARDRRAAA